MMKTEEIAIIIWQEHSRWNGKPAPTPETSWGWKAAERIAEELKRRQLVDEGLRTGMTA